MIPNEGTAIAITVIVILLVLAIVMLVFAIAMLVQAIREEIATARSRRRIEYPKGAVSVVKPKGTEETGDDRPAAPI